LNGLGYRIISVDIDTLDWEYDDSSPATAIQNYKDGYTAGGSISLNHDPYEITVNTVVPAIITYLATKGLTCKLDLTTSADYILNSHSNPCW
jgi:peptidoglycan/xylan/chitin deacetylase (PgdA/CDA1 family)